ARRLDLDRAAGLGGEPREDAQQRRFPAARWSDDADEFARRDAQVDVVEGNHATRTAQVFLAQSDDVDRRAAPLDGHSYLPPADALTSAAPGELAVLVLEDERGELAQRVVDVALVHDPIGRELGVAHLALEEPSLHVEHALDIDGAVRAARRPRIFVQQFR